MQRKQIGLKHIKFRHMVIKLPVHQQRHVLKIKRN